MTAQTSFGSLPRQVPRSSGPPKRYSKLPLLSSNLLDEAPDEVRSTKPKGTSRSVQNGRAQAESRSQAPVAGSSQARSKPTPNVKAESNGSAFSAVNGREDSDSDWESEAEEASSMAGSTSSSGLERTAASTRASIRSSSLAKRYRKVETDRQQFHQLVHTGHTRPYVQ